MTLASRQHSCPACGKPFEADEGFDFEMIIDGSVRYIAVHPGETIYKHRANNDTDNRA